MYLLDTNVVSELRRPGRAHPRVRGWAAAEERSAFFLSVVTVLELERGVLLAERRDAPQGRELRVWLEEELIPAFEGRILSIDTPVAQRCAGLHVPDPKPERDALIAATALVHGLTVVTRNVSDFERTGVTLLNPWAGETAQ